MNKKFAAILVVSGMLLGAGSSQAAGAAEVKKEAWKPVDMAKDAKPVTTKLMDKGAGHENWIIKMVSACDQNNVWCVATDGAKEGVFQLTSRGLEHRFDGVFVSAGKGIVTALNAQNEVFELEGGTGTNWHKVEGLKLSKVSRPSVNTGWGLLEKEKGKTTCFSYNAEEQVWEVVKDNEGQPAEGIIDLCANAEDAVLALNDKGELLKGDLHRKQMYEKAKEVMKEVAKESKKKGHGKKGKGKKGKKAAAGMVDANHDGKDDRDTDGDGKVSAAEEAAYAAAHKATPKKGHGKKGKGKKGKKAAAGMIDANHDGKDDRDTDGDGKVSAAEEAAYAAAHKATPKKGHGKKGKGKKGKHAKMVDANHDGKDDRDADGDGKVSAVEEAAYAAAHK